MQIHGNSDLVGDESNFGARYHHRLEGDYIAVPGRNVVVDHSRLDLLHDPFEMTRQKVGTIASRTAQKAVGTQILMHHKLPVWKKDLRRLHFFCCGPCFCCIGYYQLISNPLMHVLIVHLLVYHEPNHLEYDM